jgi:hypothetical protein
VTTLTLDLDAVRERPAAIAAGRRRHRQETFAPTRAHVEHRRGGPTLDELLVGVWEGLSAHEPVACPICSAAMVPRGGSGPGPAGGRCGGCGTTIA